MNSPGVPILPAVTCPGDAAISSTGKRNQTAFAASKRLSQILQKWLTNPELRLLSEVCESRCAGHASRRPVDHPAERKESVRDGSMPRDIPNRKERSRAAHQLLLNAANTARIQALADQQRRHNAVTDGKVMDRGNLCVAGGYDAV